MIVHKPQWHVVAISTADCHVSKTNDGTKHDEEMRIVNIRVYISAGPLKGHQAVKDIESEHVIL